MCGRVAVAEREDKTDGVRQSDAHERIEGVQRQDAGVLRNVRLQCGGCEPDVADRVDAVDGGENEKENRDVDEKPAGPTRARRANGRGREGSRAWSSGGEFGHGGSGLGERELAGGGVVIENFGVAAPLDGGLKLAAGFVLAEMF